MPKRIVPLAEGGSAYNFCVTSPTYDLGHPGYLASALRLITGTEMHQIDIVRSIHILDETVVNGDAGRRLQVIVELDTAL